MKNQEEDIFIDHDARWKEIIANLFEDFIKFFLPKAHKLIDFKTKVIFLEQELLKLFPDKDRKGRVINDKLVKVKLKTGEEKWILIHIEVQSSYEVDFSERMFTYFYRIFDKYSQKITAIAIYTGDKVPRKYDQFEYDFLGTTLFYRFNTYKIKSISEKELLASNNPFALAVLANKYLIKSKKDYDKRYTFKLKLIRLCKEREYSDRQIVNLLHFINLILVLPESIHAKFKEKIVKDYIKQPSSMKIKRTEAELKFAHEIHMALYGESFDDRVNRAVKKIVPEKVAKEVAIQTKELEEKVTKELEEKVAAEKKIIIIKLIKTADLTDKQISKIVDVPVNMVKKTRKEMKGK